MCTHPSLFTTSAPGQYSYWVILQLISPLRASLPLFLSVSTRHYIAFPYSTSHLGLGPFGLDLAFTAGLNDSSNPSLLGLYEKEAFGGLARRLLQATQRLPLDTESANVISVCSLVDCKLLVTQ